MTRSAILRRAGAGFSLVELSIVTLIIGIFLTLGLSAMNAVRENTALSATNAKQAAIKEALIGYLRRNSRLPCPDTDLVAGTNPDGSENRTTPGNPATACSARFGILPYVTLGLARDAAQDGWGNFFSYHVSNTATSTDWTLTANFRTGNTGTITLNTRVVGVSTLVASSVVAVVVSHGPNGLGSYTLNGQRNAMPSAGTDELDNTNGTADLIYYRRDPTTDDAATGGPFDDIVLYLTADDLLNPLYKDGSLKPPASLINDAFTKIKLAVVGYAMSTSSSNGTGTCSAVASPRCRLIPWADSNANGTANVGTTSGTVPWTPLGLTQSDATDPYGTLYTYAVNSTVATTTTGFSSSGPAAITSATAALVLTASNGTSTTITVGELRGYFVAGSTFP